jgi:predicted hotdog family 3-hydroxylacyl-ACP dehydratase
VQEKAMSKKINEIEVQDLIPQRSPFVMIDRLVHVSENSATSEFEVLEKNILVNKGLFRESGVIENIAQTAAAMNGYNVMAGGSEVKNGYIGGIKNLDILSLPKVGETVTTKVTEEHRVMGASVIRGESSVGIRVIAKCEMKVFLD